MDPIVTMIESADLKTLRVWVKQPAFAGYKPQIETKMATLVTKPNKPPYRPKYEVSAKGGLVHPSVLYKDDDGTFGAVDAMIANLERFKTDPNARTRQPRS